MINKFKQFGEKIKESSLRVRTTNSDESSVKYAVYGLLCPECKVAFEHVDVIKSHWITCQQNSNLNVLNTKELICNIDNTDIDTLEEGVLRQQCRELRQSQLISSAERKLLESRAGNLAAEVAYLRKEIDDVTTKCSSTEEINSALQETYLAQIQRNEELRQILEQKGMPGVDDVKVLSRELSQLHSVLNEKESSWDDKFRDITLKLGETQNENGSLVQQLSHYKSRIDDSEDKIRSYSSAQQALQLVHESQLLTIKELQVENKNMTCEIDKLTLQHKAMVDSNETLNEELMKHKLEQATLHKSIEVENSHKQQIVGLEEKLSRVASEKEQLVSKIGTDAITDVLYQQYQNQITDLHKDVQTERDKFSEYKIAAVQAKALSDSEVEKLAQENRSIRGELDRAHAEISSRKLEHNDACSKLNDEIAANNTSINQLQADVMAKQSDVYEREREISALQVKLKSMEYSLEASNSEQDKLRIAYDSLQNKYDEEIHSERDRCQDLQKELDTARTDFTDLNNIIDRKEDELKRTLDRASKAEDTLSYTIELKESISQQILDMDCALQEAREEISSHKTDVEVIKIDLACKTELCAELSQEKEILLKQVTQQVGELDANEDVLKKATEEHNSVKSLLIGQKLDLQNELSLAKQRCSALALDQESLASKHSVQLAEVSGEAASYKRELAKVRAELTKQKQELEHQTSVNRLTKARYEEQISSYKNSESKLQQEKSTLADKLGDSINRFTVQDARLHSVREENKQLNNKIALLEEDLSTYKQKFQDLQMEFTDAKSALNDMGHEHQKLAVDQFVRKERHWQDDTNITECNACRQGFSIAHRKHHCRNCGLIFCQNCTSKQAKLPSSKTQVRVCEICYQELLTKFSSN